MGLYSVISVVAAVTIGLSAVTLASVMRLGARSEESLGAPASVEAPRTERSGPY